jgi:hypothetical protein
MYRRHTRSMSFSHETAEATVQENRCYGAAIGGTLAALLANPGASNRKKSARVLRQNFNFTQTACPQNPGYCAIRKCRGCYANRVQVPSQPRAFQRPAVTQVRRRRFCPFFLKHLKTIFLPRQARDKHRENSKKTHFLADSCHAISPTHPPGPPPPHTAGYIVSGAGNKECNGKYYPVEHPTGKPAYRRRFRD